MKTFSRQTLGQLHEQFQSYNSRYTIYRGVTSVDQKLISTLGRLSLKPTDTYRSVEKKST